MAHSRHRTTEYGNCMGQPLSLKNSALPVYLLDMGMFMVSPKEDFCELHASTSCISDRIEWVRGIAGSECSRI